MKYKPSSIYQEKDGSVIGYMDITDFECELGVAAGGNIVYPSPEDVLKNKSCADECGIVEVAVSFRRVIQEPKI